MRRARGGWPLLALAVLFLALHLLPGCAAEGEDEEVGSPAQEEPEAPMEEKEKAALYAAIGSFVGKTWNGSGLFPDPCGQTPIQGVSCDLLNGLWYPTVVTIGPVLDNSLQCAPDARFSPQLFDLRRLKSLTFYACFPSIPAANWDKLSGTLETLEFRSNPGLAGAIPASLGRLASLQSLVLVDNNNLTGAVPPELGGLAKLRRLVLSGNALSGSVPATLGGLKGLLKMDLSNNRLDGHIPPEFAGLESLTLLDLRNNSLTGGLPDFVQGMTALQDVLLSSNPLGGTLMQHGWEKMASLATLDLSNVGLFGSIPESMAAMTKLRFLALDHNRLSGTVPAKLAALPSIGAMYLNGNNLTGALDFSAGFYQRMGSRFASWDNPGLCTAETAGSAPAGVAVCKDAEDPPSVGVRDRMDGGGRKPEASSSLPASSASAGMVTAVWCLVLVQWMAVVLLS